MLAGQAFKFAIGHEDMRRLAAIRDDDGTVFCRLLGAANIMIKPAAGNGCDVHTLPVAAPRHFHPNFHFGYSIKIAENPYDTLLLHIGRGPLQTEKWVEMTWNLTT